MKKHLFRYVWLVLGVAGGLAGCQQEEDPFVDRVQSPVLVWIENADRKDYLAGGGLYAEPSVSVPANQLAAPVQLTAVIYELDKSGLLNHEVGIDSIPVANLAITLQLRNGTRIADLVTDANGRVTLSKTWQELSVAAPREGSNVRVAWSGTHKGQPFLRYSRVDVVKPK
jgi:hypothetical protein